MYRIQRDVVVMCAWSCVCSAVVTVGNSCSLLTFTANLLSVIINNSHLCTLMHFSRMLLPTCFGLWSAIIREIIRMEQWEFRLTSRLYRTDVYNGIFCNYLWSSVTVQCSTVLYCTVTVFYCAVPYSTVQNSTVEYSTVQYSTVQYHTVQYSIVQYSRVKYSTVQYSTV